MGRGGGLQNKREHHIILTKYEAVHPTVVSENNSSSGMLIILTINRTVCINICVGGSKSSETNPIPENGLILSD